MKDVCEVLDLRTQKVVQRLEDDVLSKYPIVDSLGRTQLACGIGYPTDNLQHIFWYIDVSYRLPFLIPHSSFLIPQFKLLPIIYTRFYLKRIFNIYILIYIY